MIRLFGLGPYGLLSYRLDYKREKSEISFIIFALAVERVTSSVVAMSGRDKGGRTRAKAKSRSAGAGLEFAAGRTHHQLFRMGNYGERIGGATKVYLIVYQADLLPKKTEMKEAAAAV